MKISSLINRFFKGIKAYFTSEFRYYTITFFALIVILAILTPIFIILDIEKLNNIELVYVIGISSGLIYIIYGFLLLSGRIRQVFFKTKWKFIFGIIIPIVGTIGLLFLGFHLIETIPTQMATIVIYILFIAFFAWIVVQLLVFGLFIKDINLYFLKKIEETPEKIKKRLLGYTGLFSLILLVYVFLIRPSFTEITTFLNTKDIFTMPFNLWFLPLGVLIFSAVLLFISLIRKKYHSAFFSMGYILLYSFYLFYHIGYIMVLLYIPPALFIGTINLLTLLIFTISVIYSLQAVAGTIKTTSEKWWQPISFFLFAIVIFYVTWSVTFLYNLATYAGVPDIILEEFFWAVNHIVSYLFGILLLIITTIIFLGKFKIKKEEN
ncbi:MAG: hypothetical protein ACTSRL_05550 [Candidatus Helarchaeota archaeon]